MNKFAYIENYATGIKKVINAYAPYTVKPQFETTANFFVVRLPSINPGLLNKTNGAETTLNDSRITAILELIKKDNTVSQTVLTQQTGIPRRTLQRIMKLLEEKNIIKRIGKARGGKWEIQP